MADPVSSFYSNINQRQSGVQPKTNGSDPVSSFYSHVTPVQSQPQQQAPQVQPQASQQSDLFQKAENVAGGLFNAGKNLIQSIPGFIKGGATAVKSAVQNPTATAAGAGIGVLDFGNDVSKILIAGNPGLSLITQNLPERFDVTKQIHALQDINNERFPTMDQQSAMGVGHFITSLLPYALGGEVVGAAVGDTLLVPAAEKFLPKAVKFIPMINNAVGFTGVGQIEYDPQTDESRISKFKSDLITVALMETGFKALGLGAKLSVKTAGLMTDAVKNASEKIKSGNPVPIDDIAQPLEKATQAIKEETGQTPQTLLANKMAGAKEIDIQKMNDEALRTPENVTRLTKQATEIIDRAKANDTEFKANVDQVGSDLGLQTQHGPIKLADRIVEKAIEDYSGDLSQIKDINRSTIIVNDPKQYADVIGKLKETFPEITREKNGFNSPGVGYKGAIINVRLKDGSIGEVQLTTPEMLYAKKVLGGHKLYKQVRIKAVDWEKAETQMNQLYADAAARTEARLNASSVEGKPSTIARTGGNGRPKAVTANTSSDLESRSTLTNISSTSKNLGKSEDIKTPFNTSIAQSKEKSPSKIAVSIERKAIEQGLTDKFDGLAGYDKITIKEQATKAAEVMQNLDEARAIVRGEKPLPGGLRGTALVSAMEDIIKKTGDGKLAYELANSPLVSGTSIAAQELRLAAEREPDSLAAKLQQIRETKQAAIKKALGKTPEKAISDTVKKAKSYVKKPDKYDWGNFLDSITC